MSEVVPHRSARNQDGKIREYHGQVARLDFGEGLQPIMVEFNDGAKGCGTCLGCHDSPCMTLAVDDVALPEALREFPGAPDRDICPTGAITFDASSEFAEVDGKACIGCGLCVARCPYGAVSLAHDGVAVVEISDPDDLTADVPVNSPSVTGHLRPERVGRIGPIDHPALGHMPDSIADLNPHQRARFVRNLLIECGIKCRTRRMGDTNVRMDGVLATSDGRLGPFEIEFRSDVLESQRELLEDVAVLRGRYGIEVTTIDPVSVLTQLPSTRTEYYRVMDDIEKVLGLRCRTVTVGALLAVFWHFESIDGFPGDLFITSPNGTDLLSSIRHYISNSIPDNPPYEGAYQPIK